MCVCEYEQVSGYWLLCMYTGVVEAAAAGVLV